ncbi:hypothetical protein AM593_07308, partial [Mytilus galloprovincialis]
LLDFLEYYLSITYPDQPSRYGLVLVRLSELNFYAFQHLEGIREMLRYATVIQGDVYQCLNKVTVILHHKL